MQQLSFTSLGTQSLNHLNPRWGGGDSGAIGEGFGDYWAATYIARTPSGLDGDKFKIFRWDGIDACWGGRRLDRKAVKYDPKHAYIAHENLAGFVADELWSTPLFNSLLELLDKGETADSVDQVVLTSMQGIGSSFTMRTLALSVVVTARSLYPGKPHAAVFQANFKLNGILPD